MRVFMTGATGLVGRALTLRLMGGGHEVVAWVRDANRARNLLGPDVQIVSAAAGAPPLAKEMAGADTVVNLAGESVLGARWTAQRRQALWQSRVDLTAALVAAMKSAQPRPSVLVSASAVGYYGDRGDELLDERSLAGTDFLARLCHDWEEAALRARQDGVRVFIPRLGIVLALDGGALAQMLPAFQVGAGGPIGSGRQWMGWIHLSDVVEIIATALQDERYREPAIAAAPAAVTSLKFAGTLAGVLQRPGFMRVPQLALRAMFGEGATVLTAGQRVIPLRLTELGFKWRYDNLESALHNLLAEDNPSIERIDANSPKPENPNASRYLEMNRPDYLLRHKTRVNAPVSEVFSFFSKAENLGVMTPADLHFQITSTTPITMGRGTRIEYKLRPGPVALSWRTLIEIWERERLMIDYQEKGPYRCWWHEHHFQPEGGATLMEDRVYFAPPFGVIGAAAGRFMVMPALRRIFRFRAQAIRLRFPDVRREPAAGEARGVREEE
jgi:uncharacterized protein (TIGR01777 family)